MNINDQIETVVPKDYYYGFPSTYIKNGWDWKAILTPTLTTLKHNWTCKACGIKIHDDAQITTPEPRRPSYHIACWDVLYQRALSGIMVHNINTMKQIEGVELTPCQNANVVQNES